MTLRISRDGSAATDRGDAAGPKRPERQNAAWATRGFVTLWAAVMPRAQQALETKTLTDGTVLVRDARGSAHLTRLAPGVLSYVCTGFLSTSFYEPMVALAQREADRGGPVVMFVDGWELQAVDTGFREAWTIWFRRHKHHFQMRLLVRSKLMEMAASLANLFTGLNVVKTFSTYEAWERACLEDYPAFRRAAHAVG